LPSSTSIPAKTSDLQNDSNFITSAGAPVQSVNNKTGAVSLTASDVGAIATETDPVFSASAASGITSSDISDWNGKAETSDIPTVVSELTNDAGYTTNTGDMEKSTYDTNNNGVVDKAELLSQTLHTSTKSSTSGINNSWSGIAPSINLVSTGVYYASATLTYTASANTAHYPIIGIGATATLSDQQVKDQKYCASTGARQFTVAGIITGVSSVAVCATTGTSSVTATATNIELRVIRIA
jgi:hypothetical protein